MSTTTLNLKTALNSKPSMTTDLKREVIVRAGNSWARGLNASLAFHEFLNTWFSVEKVEHITVELFWAYGDWKIWNTDGTIEANCLDSIGKFRIRLATVDYLSDDEEFVCDDDETIYRFYIGEEDRFRWTFGNKEKPVVLTGSVGGIHMRIRS